MSMLGLADRLSPGERQHLRALVVELKRRITADDADTNSREPDWLIHVQDFREQFANFGLTNPGFVVAFQTVEELPKGRLIVGQELMKVAFPVTVKKLQLVDPWTGKLGFYDFEAVAEDYHWQLPIKEFADAKVLLYECLNKWIDWVDKNPEPINGLSKKIDGDPGVESTVDRFDNDDLLAILPQGPHPAPSTPINSIELLDVYSNNLASERYAEVVEFLSSTTGTANDKLKKIDSLLPIPPTTSAEVLGKLLRVSKQAISKCDWWITNRKGAKAESVDRRETQHRKRQSQRDYAVADEE